jgi:hypothetical protein
MITTSSVISCEFCNKKFTLNDNLTRHQKLYCNKRSAKDARIKELEARNKELQEKLLSKHTTSDTTPKDTAINNYENTSTEKLTDSAINKLINDSKPHLIISKFIKELHFNPDIPENHNIYISNRSKNNAPPMH